jgi:hypothetical protein
MLKFTGMFSQHRIEPLNTFSLTNRPAYGRIFFRNALNPITTSINGKIPCEAREAARDKTTI